jgi:hypothetical protein
MLTSGIFGMRTRLLTLSLENPKKNAETISKTNQLFIYGDTHYSSYSFYKTALKIGKF